MIKDLAKFYRVHAIDVIGMGLSSRPKFVITDPNEVIDYLVESVEQWRVEMNIEKLIFCGHSFGGYISSHYAYKYPERVDNLFLLSTVGFAKREEAEL